MNHDSSIGEWLYVVFSHLQGPGSIPDHGRVADHAVPNLTRPEPACKKMVQPPLNGTTQPVDTEEEGRGPIMDRQ